MIHRRKAPNVGRWDGVGGKVEAGENPFAACIREVAEETGLTVTSPVLRAVWVVVAHDTGQIWMLYTFTAPVPVGEPVASDEGDLAWVDLDRLADLPVMPDTRLILPHVLATPDVLMIREDLDTEDIDSMSRLEVIGPPAHRTVLYHR